jgi:hypothetical protein
MQSVNERTTAYGSSVLLAGLEAGILGTFAMLVWLGMSAAWQRRSFWTAANLMATTFYGDAAIHSGFARSTISGLALYFSLYGALGALFARAFHGRASGPRLMVSGIVFAVVWYYFSFALFWKKFSPLVWLLHTEHPTVAGHVIYGSILGRFPRLVRRQAGAGEPRP